VTKSELGTKRICGNCNLKFYDLHKTPIVCPTCQAIFEPPKLISEKPRRSWDATPAPVRQPVKAPARPAIVPGDATDEDAVATEEKNADDVSVDEDFEKE
jgi:uncharacterized protein (TIGR02300 family)